MNGSQEIVFNKIVGDTYEYGTIGLRLINDSSKTKNITVKISGQITSGTEPVTSDQNRIKDSRHVHIVYTRQIATSTDAIELLFTHADGSTSTQDIAVADNIKFGQIYWSGEIDIDNEAQILEIETHRLNSPDTEFSIRRDRRYNTKALTIKMVDDHSGSLITYSADGQTTRGTSIYVSEPELQ